MPISPTPPSGAKTSSSEGPGIFCLSLLPSGARQHEHISGRNGFGPVVVEAQHQIAVCVDALKPALKRPIGEADSDSLSDECRPDNKVRAHTLKSLPSIPLCETPMH